VILFRSKKLLTIFYGDIVKEIVEKFKDKTVLVVGDIMLDEFIIGEVERISPEAPVQVVNVKKRYSSLGGGGNVIRNLLSLGATVYVSSVLGREKETEEITEKISYHLKKLGVSSEGIIFDDSRKSTKKIRVLSEKGQQLLRIDIETKEKISSICESFIYQNVKERIAYADILLLSDYDKGILTEKLSKNIISLAKKQNKPVVVDPKGENFCKYMGATVVTPNKKEALKVSKLKSSDMKKVGRYICSSYHIPSVLITLGEEGILLIEKGKKPLTISTKAREVFDVSGAGDTMVATFALGLATGASMLDSAKLANISAGIVVGKRGVSTVTRDEIIGYTKGKKFISSDVSSFLDAEREKGNIIVFTNGCFDILHAGHVAYLQDAKNLGDILVVGLNSDKSVKKLKGERRPIICEEDRIQILSSLSCIDYVCLFDEKNPLQLIKKVKPDVLVKASDYKKEDIVGKDFVESYGGKVETVDFVKDKSTTSIIKKLERRT